MNKISDYTIIFVVVSLLCLVSNSIVFDNYIEQQQVVADIERNSPTIKLKYLADYDIKYPNITIYTTPFKTYLGRVYLRDSMYEEAINSFHAARQNNPYLRINENYLADVYTQMHLLDSASYYTRLAFEKMPNHPAHFGRYLELILEDDSKIIDSIFNTLIHKDELMWKIYLSALSSTKIKSKLAKENLETALDLFPKNQKIELAVDYNIYGYDNVEKARKYNEVSEAFINQENYNEAFKVLQKATPLHPYNKYYQSLMTLSYKLGLFKETVAFSDSIDKTKFFDEGRYFLVKGVSLVQLNRREEACQLLTKSIFKGNREAIKARKTFCGK